MCFNPKVHKLHHLPDYVFTLVSDHFLFKCPLSDEGQINVRQENVDLTFAYVFKISQRDQLCQDIFQSIRRFLDHQQTGANLRLFPEPATLLTSTNNFSGTLKNVHPLLLQPVRQIDQNPVFGKLIPFSSIDVNNTHICTDIIGWQP